MSTELSNPWHFSKAWTDGDKVRLAVLLTHLIRDDIEAGRYNRPGRPNIQSLHELLAMSPEELETHRAEIEALGARQWASVQAGYQ
ncbi:MAG: hypothetical protein ACLQVI_35620 [Polyangiaceae bacterium]